jgi:hypothetical protein
MNPVLPGDGLASLVDERLLDHSDGGLAAVAVEFDRLVGPHPNNDFFARLRAEMAEGEAVGYE